MYKIETLTQLTAFLSSKCGDECTGPVKMDSTKLTIQVPTQDFHQVQRWMMEFCYNLGQGNRKENILMISVLQTYLEMDQTSRYVLIQL